MQTIGSILLFLLAVPIYAVVRLFELLTGTRSKRKNVFGGDD